MQQIKTISKSQFKAKALEYMRYVEQNNQTLIITDLGNPVVNLVPHKPSLIKSDLYSLRGTLLKYDDPMDPVGVEDWEALK